MVDKEKSVYWIKLLTTRDEIIQAKKSWQIKYHFQTLIGVIDCTHIGVKPRLYEDECINLKNKPTPSQIQELKVRENLLSCYKKGGVVLGS